MVGRILKGVTKHSFTLKHKSSGPHGFRVEYFFLWEICVAMKTIVLIRSGPSDASDKIWLRSANWLPREIFMFESVDGRTDTCTDAGSKGIL